MATAVKFTETVQMVTMECARCGVVFAVTEDYERRRRKDGAAFMCPSGHSNAYGKGQSEEAKLRAQLEAERKRAEAAEKSAKGWREYSVELSDRKKAVEKNLSATKGQLTKVKNRIHNGVCPCCRRNFPNLGEHIRKEHPEFTKAEE